MAKVFRDRMEIFRGDAEQGRSLIKSAFSVVMAEIPKDFQEIPVPKAPQSIAKDDCSEE